VTCGVWVGFDQPQTILEGGYGAKLALPVWVDMMNAAQQHDYKLTALKAEPLFARASLCRVSGQLATSNCASRGDAYEDELPVDLVPQVYCAVHAEACRRSGAAAGILQPLVPVDQVTQSPCAVRSVCQEFLADPIATRNMSEWGHI